MNGDIMEEIDLKELFNVFWNKKIFIIIVTILFAIIGFIYTKYIVKPIYKSTATLVLTKSDSTEETTITQTEVTLNQQLVATYTELIKTKNILGEVINNLGYEDITEEELKEDITVELVSSTQLIEISVKNSNPERAKNLTNEIADVFVKREKEIYKLDNISKVDEAKLPTTPDNINHKKDIVMFTIMGFVVSMGIVFIISLFDTTIKNSEEVEKRLGLTVLASIPQYDYEMKKKGKE
jgi:capsular polysaccharide biosynthesis protein